MGRWTLANCCIQVFYEFGLTVLIYIGNRMSLELCYDFLNLFVGCYSPTS